MKVDWSSAVRLAQKVTTLQAAQEQAGTCFDKERAEQLVEHIKVEMEKLEGQVLPALPMRGLKKSEQHAWQMPLKPFKKDGSYSELMIRFAAKVGGMLLENGEMEWEGQTVRILGGYQLDKKVPMALGEQDDLKSWLVEQGWSPTLWNFKRGKDGKPERDDRGEYIKTSPKIQENGKLCPNLEAMQGDLVRLIVKWFSYRNRKSVLEGWLKNPRLEYDGRLTAAISGITNTHRVKHTIVANLPKADGDVLLGKEVRSLFCAPEGKVCVGYDASGIESRVEGHFVYKYPGGAEYANELINGDIHSKTAQAVFKNKLAGIVIDKENPQFKPFRHKAKTLKYAMLYGAQKKKVASILGCSLKEAEEVYNAFWASAPPLAAFRDALLRFWETQGEKRYLVGIDGRRLHTRSKHSTINTLFQNCGQVVMDVSYAWMDKQLGGLKLVDNCPCYVYNGYIVTRNIQYHDEALWYADPDIADEIGQLGVKSIEWAGRFLKMNVPLTGDYKVGQNWSEVH